MHTKCFVNAIADPPGVADTFQTEKLVRLLHGFLRYQPRMVRSIGMYSGFSIASQGSGASKAP